MDTSKQIHLNGNYSHLSTYYRFHSKIYDYTRWMFLFGRKEIISHLPNSSGNLNILEIGCGTGFNLIQLAYRYPKAIITGLDLSDSMLAAAHKNIAQTNMSNRISLKNEAYGPGLKLPDDFDIILCSYSLSMMGSQKTGIIDQIKTNLNSDGLIAVVDFHNSPFSWFRRWMQINHVDMNGSLYKYLISLYTPNHISTKSVYGNLWSYFIFTGRVSDS